MIPAARERNVKRAGLRLRLRFGDSGEPIPLCRLRGPARCLLTAQFRGAMYENGRHIAHARAPGLDTQPGRQNLPCAAVATFHISPLESDDRTNQRIAMLLENAEQTAYFG